MESTQNSAWLLDSLRTVTIFQLHGDTNKDWREMKIF